MSKIRELEAHIQQNLDQVSCPVRHYFVNNADGKPCMMAREMTIPAGVMLTGAMHKTEHLNTISAGRIIVYTEHDDGTTSQTEVAAPNTFISQPGIKRAGFALEETVWTTYHVTATTDIDALVEELTDMRNCELLGGRDNVQLLNQKQRELTHVAEE